MANDFWHANQNQRNSLIPGQTTEVNISINQTRSTILNTKLINCSDEVTTMKLEKATVKSEVRKKYDHIVDNGYMILIFFGSAESN